MAKRKKSGTQNNGAVAEPVVDEAPKTDIPIPGAGKAAGARPEVKELSEVERLRSQNFAAQQALIKEQEQNIALQERNVQLQAENLRLRKELLSRAKQETTDERAEWFREMGVGQGDSVSVRDGKMIIQRGTAK